MLRGSEVVVDTSSVTRKLLRDSFVITNTTNIIAQNIRNIILRNSKQFNYFANFSTPSGSFTSVFAAFKSMLFKLSLYYYPILWRFHVLSPCLWRNYLQTEIKWRVSGWTPSVFLFRLSSIVLPVSRLAALPDIMFKIKFYNVPFSPINFWSYQLQALKWKCCFSSSC